MPRILPRLIETLKTSNQEEVFIPFIKKPPKRYSLHRPIPPTPSFNADNYQRSILLSTGNPITNSTDYVRHKTLPPLTHILRTKSKTVDHDHPRAMHDIERSWWSNPYLRMLSSPIRSCIVTWRHLPIDFLVRLVVMPLPSPRSSLSSARGNKGPILLPDGLQHSKFTVRRSGKGNYALCSREAITALLSRHVYKRLAPGISAYTPLLDHIAHLLRLRVLQELDLLADVLEKKSTSTDAAPRILRRLTRWEWNMLRETGEAPYEGAVAIIVVPPLQKDAVTKKRPEGAMSSLPPAEEESRSCKPLPPLSVLYSVRNDACPPASKDLPDVLGGASIPLYNGVALFPHKSQRAALYSQLCRILAIARHKRQSMSSTSSLPKNADRGRAPGDARGSHAFLLTSDRETAKSADVAPLAIALWRVRMYEGANSDDRNWIQTPS